MNSSPPAPEERFSSRVANYVKYRPGYPEGLMEVLKQETGLSSSAVVADVGSGTGISAAFLLRSGCTVYGVEPNVGMRTAAEEMLHGESRFHSVKGMAQATTLEDASVDLVTSFQAFHWFQGDATRAEFTRILKPGGKVALVWNVRLLDATPFLKEYEALLLEFGTDYSAVRHENIGNEELGGFFKNGVFTKHSLPSEQTFDFEGLKGRLLSSSYAPAAGDERHLPMLRLLEDIFNRNQSGGRVSFLYDTQVYTGH